MLTYRGDKFVKGKKFKIEEREYRFSKRFNEKLIFESVEDNSILEISEEEYENKLEEAINKENSEMNEIIAKVLRSKGAARKYEDMLKQHGITIDYSPSQGVFLKGPNGKTLSSSSKEVFGPTKPGHNNTHKQVDSYYTRSAERYKGYVKEYEDELKSLEAMDRDDIIRKYPDKTTDEALAAHKERIERIKKNIEEYKKDSENTNDNIKAEKKINMRTKRAGHAGAHSFGDEIMSKDFSNSHVDYLNYLTKTDYEKPYGDTHPNALSGNYDDKRYGRNGRPGQKSERLKKYGELKDRIAYAKGNVARSSADTGSYSSYKSDEALEAEIQRMRDELEQRIEKLKADNEYKKAGNKEDIEALQAREKELDDYLKSLGIRESIINLVKKSLNESTILNEKSEEYDTYFKEALNKLSDNLSDYAMEAGHNGYQELADTLQNAMDIIDSYYIKYYRDDK